MVIFAAGQIDGNDGIVQRTGIGCRHVMGHAVGDTEEDVTGDTHDVGCLGRVIAIAQYQIDSAGVDHGMQPGDTADDDSVVVTVLPAGEAARQTIAVVIKGIDPRQVAAVILHIDQDVVIAGAAVHHILTGHDAVVAHLSVGQHAHLERCRVVKRQIDARGIGNLFAVDVGLTAVGRINQHSALGRRLHVHGNRRIIVAAGLIDDRIAIDQVLLDVAVHLARQ